MVCLLEESVSEILPVPVEVSGLGVQLEELRADRCGSEASRHDF